MASSWPDTAVRYFNEYDVNYESTGTSIELYRRDWEGLRKQVAHIEFVAESDPEDVEIPGDDSDPNSQERVMELKIREGRLATLLNVLSTPGWKRIFGNEDSNFWRIRVHSGYGPGVT